jgi:hypothetical protein
VYLGWFKRVAAVRFAGEKTGANRPKSHQGTFGHKVLRAQGLQTEGLVVALKVAPDDLREAAE